jgi:hypothetical protein
MVATQQGFDRVLASVKRQQKSSSSGTGLVSDTERYNARKVELLGKSFVCTFLPVAGFAAHFAASPCARSAVMQAGSQLRSSCNPLTWPLLLVMMTHTSVEVVWAVDASALQTRKTATARPYKLPRIVRRAHLISMAIVSLLVSVSGDDHTTLPDML